MINKNTISDAFVIQAKLTPKNIAVVYEDTTITYQVLNEKSNQLAHFLRSKGVAEDMPVPICISRSIEMIIGILGILKAGGAYVPIDPEYPKDRIDYVLKDTNSKLVIIENGGTDNSGTDNSDFLRINNRDNSIEVINIESDWSSIAQQPITEPEINLHPHHLAYIIYTSGSTGKPKGVMVEHRNVISLFFAAASLFDFRETDTWTMFHSFCFDFSVWEMYGALLYGGRLVIVPKSATKDVEAFSELILKENVTILNQTPSAFYVLQDYILNKTTNLPLRYVIFGGEALIPSKIKKWKALYKNCDLINMYGITETTVHVSFIKLTDAHCNSSKSVIGGPLSTLYAYVLDAEQQKAPTGTIGELYIGGEGLARGYLNLPELTANRFIKDPFSIDKNARLYRTGDLAKIIADGSLEYFGRIDDQVKINGFRIEPGEIETLLAEQEEIKQVLVMAREDKPGDVRLVAYIVLNSPTTNNKALINTFKEVLKAELPYFMVPRNFVFLDNFPLTPNNKIDKKSLPKPQLIATDPNTKKESPSNQNEILVSEIWSGLLDVTDIDINDDFFDIGGNSILAAKTMMQIEKLTGKRLSLSNLFKYPTIKELASVIEDPVDTPYGSLVGIKSEGSKLPLYIVHGIGLNVLNFRSMVFNLDKDQPVYGMQSLGLDNRTEQFDDMEQIASAYNSEIMMHNPDGPYLIAGYSFGGYIAYEMVRQLKALGKDVRMLAMFDTNLQYPTHQYSFFKKVYKKLFRQILKFLFRIKSIMKQPKENIKYLKEYYGIKPTSLYKNTDFQYEYDSENLPDFMKKIVDKLLFAFNRYIIVPVDIKIDLFKAKKRLYFVDDPEYLGWKDYAKQEVIVHVVPGDHKDMFTPPNDAILAKILQKRLDELNN